MTFVDQLNSWSVPPVCLQADRWSGSPPHLYGQRRSAWWSWYCCCDDAEETYGSSRESSGCQGRIAESVKLEKETEGNVCLFIYSCSWASYSTLEMFLVSTVPSPHPSPTHHLLSLSVLANSRPGIYDQGCYTHSKPHTIEEEGCRKWNVCAQKHSQGDLCGRERCPHFIWKTFLKRCCVFCCCWTQNSFYTSKPAPSLLTSFCFNSTQVIFFQRHACCCCFSKSTEGKNNVGLVFVSRNTCRPQTWRAAGSTIKHSWERWKDCEGQCGLRDTESQAEAESVSLQRLMGLMCINSELLLFLWIIVCVCEAGWGEQPSSFCHHWCFCSVYLRHTGHVFIL